MSTRGQVRGHGFSRLLRPRDAGEERALKGINFMSHMHAGNNLSLSLLDETFKSEPETLCLTAGSINR